jgi:phage RecT family recombinase
MPNEIANPGTAIEAQAQAKLLDVLRKYEGPIKALIGRTLDPVRFSQLAVSAIKSNPALAGCSPSSFMNSVLLAMQMGVEIRRDSAYLIPFGRQCQLLLDYKAKISLARRGGKVGGIQAVSIRERDDFESWYDERGFHVHHRPSPKGQVRSADERGALIGVYAFAELIGGGMQWREPMSMDELERIRKRSRAGAASVTLDEIREAGRLTEDGRQQVWQTWGFNDKRRTPWVTDHEAMCWKTALHSLYKGIPLDDAAMKSQEADEGFETGRQQDFMGDFHSFDPVDALPMVETTDAEGVKAIAAEKIEEGKQEEQARRGRPRGSATRTSTPQKATDATVGAASTAKSDTPGQTAAATSEASAKAMAASAPESENFPVEDEPTLFGNAIEAYRGKVSERAFAYILGKPREAITDKGTHFYPQGFVSPDEVPADLVDPIIFDLEDEIARTKGTNG